MCHFRDTFDYDRAKQLEVVIKSKKELHGTFVPASDCKLGLHHHLSFLTRLPLTIPEP